MIDDITRISQLGGKFRRAEDAVLNVAPTIADRGLNRTLDDLRADEGQAVAWPRSANG